MRLMSGFFDGLQATGMNDSIVQSIFFKLIFEFLDNEVEAFRDNMLGQALSLISALALILLTLWILIQGYRIATGQSRDSMMALVTNSLRSVLIVSVATSVAFGSSDLYHLLTTDLPHLVTHVVTGEDAQPQNMIDKSLDQMQLAMIGIDGMSTLASKDNPSLKDDANRAEMFTGIGVAGPSVVGGALLLLYKLTMALFIGLGPLFILGLLFEQTKPLFGRWLYYGIGTIFSLAVLSFMVAVAMKMVLAVATAFAAQYLAAMAVGGAQVGISSLALQQGGLGLILTVLLVMAPPMAAQFFGGVMGNFGAYSAFGQVGRGTGADSAGRQPGMAGYQPPNAPIPNKLAPQTQPHSQVATPRLGGESIPIQPPTGQRG